MQQSYTFDQNIDGLAALAEWVELALEAIRKVLTSSELKTLMSAKESDAKWRPTIDSLITRLMD